MVPLVYLFLTVAVGVAHTKPVQGTTVQVYILMGQSNMLGEGKVAGDTNGTLQFAIETEKKYQYLVDSEGNYTVLPAMRNVFIMGSGNQSFEQSTLFHNEFMTVNISKKTTIGPELGIGFTMANYTKNNPTMMLKACIGNRALGWDLLPPGSVQWEWTDNKTGTVYEYAGYHQTPEKWEKGTTPQPVNWMAGEQYDGDTNRSQIILDHIADYYPGATDYEVAGFFWWQGDRDSRDTGLSDRYEHNLVNLINVLRKQFKAPKAKFVTASLGQTPMGSTSNDGKILQAMLNVDGNSGKYPQFKGNVAAVYTHPLSMGGSSGAHYNNNAETYMNVGEGMGQAMVKLLQADEE
eukprot:m.157600 g.157600  ORF g.157600 m.157600 type:complete len:349 (+) comp24724_c0_seq1:69-1115(+)